MSDTVVLDGALSLTNMLDGQAGTIIKVMEHDLPVYTGQTEITPSTTEQVLATAEKVVTRNIVVNPIPENYGRLLYSGNTLTVY